MHSAFEYRGRFGWLRREPMAGMLSVGVRFGESCQPPVYPNYWQHLPQVILAAAWLRELVAAARSRHTPVRVLDLAASPPTAALLKLMAGLDGGEVDFRCATEDGGRFELHSDVGDLVLDTECVWLGADTSFSAVEPADIVVFTEVIEHIDCHPQRVLAAINRLLAVDGVLLMSTPNVCARKKILAISSGNWNFDSPTFSDSMGHRFEYSAYHMRECLARAGFAVERHDCRDVFFDAPRGIRAAVQYAGLAGLKLLTGDCRAAGRMLVRAGSTQFIVARKVGAPRADGGVGKDLGGMGSGAP